MAPVRTDQKTHSVPPDRARIVALARSWIGTPYHHQQSVKGIGCDCLGLVRGVYEAYHQTATGPVTPYTRDWAEASGRETLIEAARAHLSEIDSATIQPGDVLVFRFRKWMVAKHTGILTTAETMVHALEGAAVEEVHLGSWWHRHIAAAFAFHPTISPNHFPAN